MIADRQPTVAHTLFRDLSLLGGAGVVVCETISEPVESGLGVVRIGVDRQSSLPLGGLEEFDILLTARPDAPRPWVGTTAAHLDIVLADLRERIEAQPVAAAVAAQVLRMTLRLSFAEALTLESLAYSMLLGSDEFRAWRIANPPRSRKVNDSPRVVISIDGGTLSVRLNRPESRNAFDARMRDELAEALQFAVDHPDAPAVELSGEGPAFSAGGDLDEFGSATDPGWAHLIRTLRAPTRLVHQLGDRVTSRLQGACIGAGIEIPAAAAHVTGRPGASFRLPEVGMGLIPGAGGTASIPRRIGRHRACYMAVSGASIDLATALAWGLVDAPDPAP